MTLETFKLSALGFILIFTNKSQFFLTKFLIPSPSEPKIKAIFSKSFIPKISFDADPSRPIHQ